MELIQVYKILRVKTFIEFIWSCFDLPTFETLVITVVKQIKP